MKNKIYNGSTYFLLNLKDLMNSLKGFMYIS